MATKGNIMKRFNKTPDFSFTYISGDEHIGHYTETGYLTRNINHLKEIGAGILITEEILNSNTDYLCPINQNGKIGFINSFADIVITPEFDSVTDHFTTAESLVRVCKNNRYGIIDAEGNYVINCQYRSLSSIWEEHYVIIQNEVYQYAVIDINTKNEVIPYGKYNHIYVAGMYLQAQQELLRGIIDIHENIIIPFKYKWISPVEDSYYIRVVQSFKENNEIIDKWGIIDLADFFGNRIIEPYYDYIAPIKDMTAIATKFKKKCCIDLCEMREIKEYVGGSSFHPIFERESTYNDYNGSYAQDVMGYDDATISDAFEGDPDAYWNIY